MSTRTPFYWEQFSDENGWCSDRRPAGEELAALRAGLGREPGTVPSMWPFHRVVLSDDQLERGYGSPRFVGEHHALTLYAVHQQSQHTPMHRSGIRLGRAFQVLHQRGPAEDGRSKAVDRRFYAAVTASSVGEVAYHLRGLIRLLRSEPVPDPIDYTALVNDLTQWQAPESRRRIRFRWGLDFHSNSPASAEVGDEQRDPQPASD